MAGEELYTQIARDAQSQIDRAKRDSRVQGALDAVKRKNEEILKKAKSGPDVNSTRPENATY